MTTRAKRTVPPVTFFLIVLATAFPVGAGTGEARIGGINVELEAGPLWQGRNDVEIPNDGTATRFSLDDVIGRGPYLSWRVSVSYDITRKQGLRVLVAPLTIEGDGIPSEEIRFDNQTFEPRIPTEAKYRFNSYRLSYRYVVFDGDRFRWRIGFTAKIRDAKITISQGSTEASYSNVGFVPLLYVSGEWRMARRWSAILDADALAAPQGRAEDVALRLAYRFSDRWSAAAGYRTLEGGADNDKVFTFAWLHYVVAAIRYDF